MAKQKGKKGQFANAARKDTKAAQRALSKVARWVTRNPEATADFKVQVNGSGPKTNP